MLHWLKTWMLPLAMLSGAFFYEFFQQWAFLTPWLLFSMLFITYCKLSVRDMRFSRLLRPGTDGNGCCSGDRHVGGKCGMPGCLHAGKQCGRGICRTGGILAFGRAG